VTNLVAGHIVPPERGGAMLDPMNLITLCKPCNTAMGRWTLGEWQRSESYARRQASGARRPTTVTSGTASLARPLRRRPRIY